MDGGSDCCYYGSAVLELAPSLSADLRNQSSTDHAFLKKLGCDRKWIDNRLLEVIVMLLDDAFLWCRSAIAPYFSHFRPLFFSLA